MEQPLFIPEPQQVQPEPPVAQLQPKAKPPHQALKQGLVIGGTVIGIFAVLNLAIWGMYYGRAYPGVKLGNQNVSNLDRAAILSRVSAITNNYELHIAVKGQEHTVSADSLGVAYDQSTSATAAVNQGKNYWLPLYGLIYTWTNGRVDLSYQINSAKLDKVVSDLSGTASVAPTDAKVVIEGENVRVEADKPGQGIDPKVLSALIEQKVAGGDRQASIGERPTQALVSVKKAEVVVPKVQQAMKLPITVSVNGKVFTPGAAEIGKWLTTAPDKDGNLNLGTNQDAINAYAASVAGQVDVAAVTKQINMVNGEVRTVSEGKNGSALDRAAVADALAKAVTTGQNTAVTGMMTVVAYKTRTNNTVDLNGKYVEINLSRQHMWVYNDKQLVYDSPITSGATGVGFATVQGLFSIKAKQTNRNLNGYAIGYNYNVFVNYWMPFYGNYGLHDASWRSSFGGSDYYYGGSHGCVNLPNDAAAWLYNFVVVGTPVWVHS